MIRLLSAGAVLLALTSASAAGPEPASDEMNGTHLRDYYPAFLKRWHLVTVRFRKDTEEMRVTFANPKAWTALKSGSLSYPDGAIFAKVGIATLQDALFPSSAVPSGARRYQFMVRDHAKFASTDGWGYALFDSTGKIYPEKVEAQSNACAACHRLAKERGYVFSQPWQLDPFEDAHVTLMSSALRFREIKVADLPPAIRNLLDKSVSGIRAVEGELQNSLFQGTLDEIRPALATDVARNSRPAALISRDGKKFSLVMGNPSGTACHGSAGLEVIGIRSGLTPEADPYRISFCVQPGGK